MSHLSACSSVWKRKKQMHVGINTHTLVLQSTTNQRHNIELVSLLFKKYVVLKRSDVSWKQWGMELYSIVTLMTYLWNTFQVAGTILWMRIALRRASVLPGKKKKHTTTNAIEIELKNLATVKHRGCGSESSGPADWHTHVYSPQVMTVLAAVSPR